MCLSPIYIDNPYKGLKDIGLNRFHDTTSAKIPVPCGHCRSCISLRQSYYVQRCQMESLDNHLFMLTLTYMDSMIRHIKVNGRKLYYPDWTDFQKMCKRLRNRGLKFSYLAVSEYGSTRHRPHFHAIISVPKNDNDTFHDILILENKLQNMFLGEWRRNYGSDRKPKYRDLCQLVINYRGRTFDLHYIDGGLSPHGEADVSFYVTKYLLKSDSWLDKLKSALKLNLSPVEFVHVWKLLKPRCCVSKGFGNYSSDKVKKHIRKGIELALKSDSKYPFFINPIDGTTFPLSPLFQKRFLTLKDKEVFFSRSDFDDGYCESPERNVSKECIDSYALSEIKRVVNKRLTNDDFYSYDSEIENLSIEELQKADMAVFDNSPLPDDWQNDFDC